jgi:hypothetical protein
LRASKSKASRLDQSKWPAVGGGLLIALLLTLAFWYVYGGRATSSDYEGKIVDRWADQMPSNQDTRPYFRLVVETPEHKRITVKVDGNVYESARVGMGIRSRNGQVVLIDASNSSSK